MKAGDCLGPLSHCSLDNWKRLGFLDLQYILSHDLPQNLVLGVGQSGVDDVGCPIMSVRGRQEAHSVAGDPGHP